MIQNTIINEDYFNDVEIKDEDVTAAGNDSYDNNDNKCYAAKALDNHLTSKYKQCIIIKLNALSEYNFEEIDNQYISPIIKRLQYILHVYDIEYEYILRDDSNPDEGMFIYNIAYIYDLGKHKVFSLYNNEEYYEIECDELNIVLYLNLPDFNYKDSYNFIDRILYAVWKNEHNYDVVQKIYFTGKTHSLFENFSYGLDWLSNDFFVSPYQDCGVIETGLPYKRFFKKALYFFNHTDKDKHTIERMWRLIVTRGTDPFKKQK